MTTYTLTEASKAAGRSKSTILRSIRAGRLSATRDELTGGWNIDAAELHRVYDGAFRSTPDDAPRNSVDPAVLEAKDALIAALERMNADLSRRLDVATEQLGEALAQNRLLADQRAQADKQTNLSTSARRRWWRWRR